MRKIINFAVALALAVGICIPASAAGGGSFADVSSGAWYAPHVEKAASLGLVSGVGNGNYAPDKQVTYAEFATMLDNIHWKDEVTVAQAQKHPSDPWWIPQAIVADDHCLFAGTPMADEYGWYDWANKPVSRSDMAMMTYNYMLACGGKEIDDKVLTLTTARISDINGEDQQHKMAIAYCYAEGILSGTGGGKFSPEVTLNRAQAATVLCNIYAKVTGDVTGSGNQTQTPPATTKPAARPAGAVGGQYDLSKYTVPADTNKDGWITSAEVQAVLDRLKVEYPSSSEWGEKSRYPGLYEYSGGAISGGLGSGSACSGFARLVSDQIFGNLPKREVPIEQIRMGDYLSNGRDNHDNIALCSVGEGKLGEFTSPTMYNTTDGNVSGTVGWGRARYAEDWPTGTTGTHIWTRYPAE